MDEVLGCSVIHVKTDIIARHMEGVPRQDTIDVGTGGDHVSSAWRYDLNEKIYHMG